MQDWDYDENSADAEYNAYGSTDQFAEDGGGKEGESWADSENDAAADWLSAMGETDIEGKNEAYMGATSGDIITGRYAYTSDQTNLATQQILSGDITGESAGMTKLELDVAVGRMEKETGRTREQLANQVSAHAPSAVTNIDPTGYVMATKSITGNEGRNAQITVKRKRTYTKPIQDSKFIRQAVSMLNASGDVLDLGPGQKVAGNTLDPVKQERWDMEMMQANIYANDLATDYMDPRTIAGPIGELRHRQTRGEIIKRAQEGVFYDGSKVQLALPNELGVSGRAGSETAGVEGLRITASSGGYDGTQYNRATHEAKFGHLTHRGESGGIEFNDGVSQSQQDQYWATRPSLKKSLYPTGSLKGMTDAEKVRARSAQDYKMETAEFKAQYIRDVYRRQQPTLRDEAKGQINMAGFDRPYDEQDNLANIRNEAAVLELEWTASASDPNRTSTGNIVRGGQDKGGSYGYTEMSEVDLFTEGQLEAGAEAPVFDMNTDRGRYLASVQNAPKQRSTEWYAQRKGNVTASMLVDHQTGKVQTSEELALALSADKLGYGKEFGGNAHTELGNRFEGAVASAFMNGPGKGLTMEEAFFEQGEGGMGASPDARLFNADGSSAGLAEFKYLTTGAMKGALKKYTMQMQQQMLTSGEKQTHFFAKDRFTGKTQYHVVNADADMQDNIRATITDAQSIAGGITTPEELLDLNSQVKNKSRKVRNVESEDNGPDVAYTPEQEVKMKAYRAGAAESENAPAGNASASSSASSTASARGLIEAELDDSNWSSETKNSSRADRSSDDAANAMKKLTKATKETSDSVAAMGTKMASVASELAGAVTGGNTTAMDTMRFAAKSGMTAEATRGLEFALQSGAGGMDLAGTRQNMSAMGKMQSTFNDATKVEGAITSLATQWAGAGLDKSFGSMPSYSEIKGKDPQQLMGMVADMMSQTDDPEVRRQIDQVFGTSMSMSKLTGDEIRGAKVRIDEDGQREYYNGERWVAQKKQTLLEGAAAMVGEVGGAVAGALGIAGGVAGSQAAKMMIGKKAMKPIAKPAASKLGKVAKAVAGKVGPAAVLSLAPMAIREFGDIEDDGGLADSGMDILEMAAWGAAAGSVVPGVGTLVGAGIGAAAGVATEAWQYFNSDDSGSVVPSETIDKPGAVVTGGQSGAVVSNNIDVTVNVDPDMVATNVDVDGESYEVTERGLQSGTA